MDDTAIGTKGNQMTKAPEKIWAVIWDVFGVDTLLGANDYDNGEQAYVREDLYDAVVRERDELRVVLQRIDDASNHYTMTPTYSESALRYAHKSTRNLAREALKETRDE